VIAFVSHSFTMRRLLFANRPRWTLMQRRNETPQPRNADGRSQDYCEYELFWPCWKRLLGNEDIKKIQCHFVMVTTAAIE
jgi:hypothetical protein